MTIEEIERNNQEARKSNYVQESIKRGNHGRGLPARRQALFSLLIILVLIAVVWFVFLGGEHHDYLIYPEMENEQALSDLTFDIKLPSYVPNGAVMRGATIYRVNGEQTMFETRYLDESGSRSFVLYASLNETAELDQSFYWDETTVNGNIAYVGQKDSGETRIVWSEGGVHYKIESHTVRAEELIKVARSFE